MFTAAMQSPAPRTVLAVAWPVVAGFTPALEIAADRPARLITASGRGDDKTDARGLPLRKILLTPDKRDINSAHGERTARE